ncbi:MAG: hypothetical protein IPG22_05995 [Acidobacteria bacterium]|nr:hypothetical protein [Acidobacteriota bacterium]
MHLAKGLEFKAVVVMACEDEVIPHRNGSARSRMNQIFAKFTIAERQLLYVACTRAWIFSLLQVVTCLRNSILIFTEIALESELPLGKIIGPFFQIH